MLDSTTTQDGIFRETDNGIEKRCSKCEEYYPADLEHFYNDSRAKLNLSSQCIACQTGKTWDQIKNRERSNGNTMNLSDYMTDPQGRLVPIELIKELDKSRDQLVRRLVADALAVRNEMAAFKEIAMDEVRAFSELAAQEWDVTLGGKKGNITLYSFDGLYKVQIQVADRLVFDEQLQVAKKMIDECLIKWTEGSQVPPEIRAIINDAFQVDQEGKINTKRILALRRLDIKDSLWIKAMDAITASLQVIGSKEYIRLYQRATATSTWQPIALDMAAI